MDAKGRMAIPTRVREGLAQLCGGRLVVTAHTEDRCLLVFPEPKWQEILPKIQSLPTMNKASRRVQRLLIGYACSLEMDRSEEHTSELQSRPHLVCRLLLEKKKRR